MDRKAELRRIALEGQLTIHTAADLCERLIDALADAMVLEVDLSQITEADSAGLQALLGATREAAILDATIRFTRHSNALLDALEASWIPTDRIDRLLSGEKPRGPKK